MVETRSCPDEGVAQNGQDGFSFETNPEWIDVSVHWSNVINKDPGRDNVRRHMNWTYQALRSALPPNLNEANAELMTCEGVRGVLARVIGHRVAGNLVGIATRLVDGDDQPVAKVIKESSFSAVRHPDAAMKTDFGRVWYGDDARLIAALGLLITPVTEYPDTWMPPGVWTGYIRAKRWANKAREAVAVQRNLKADGSASPDGLMLLKQGEEGMRWSDRILLRNIVSGKAKVLSSFLAQNVLTVSEHTGAWLTDVMHGFIPHPSATPSDHMRAIIAQLHGPSVLAFMPNKLNGEAEYKDRYVWSESPDEGKYGSKREPLVLVEKQDTTHDVAACLSSLSEIRVPSYSIVPNPASSYVKASRSKRNRCPGPDGLDLLDEEVDDFDLFRGALTWSLRGRYGKEVLALLDRNFNYIDVATALGASVTRSLIDLGVASFDANEVRRHLGPPESATSTGANTLRP